MPKSVPENNQILQAETICAGRECPKSTSCTATPRRALSCPERRTAPLSDDCGAVTAEYAIVIMAAVAFAGLLVAIMGSGEVRGMLVDLVQKALASAG